MDNIQPELRGKGMYKKTPFSNVEVRRLPINTKDKGVFNRGIDVVPCTYLGGLSAQPFTALFAWERFLAPLQFSRFIEIGMGYGNTSLFFLGHCLNKGAKFITYENNKKRAGTNRPIKRMLKLAACRRTKNVYDVKTVEEIRGLLGGAGISIIFCDGIDKPHEFSLFAPALKPGDFIAVHDWGRASKQIWLQPTIDKYKLRSVDPDVWDNLKSITRVYER